MHTAFQQTSLSFAKAQAERRSGPSSGVHLHGNMKGMVSDKNGTGELFFKDHPDIPTKVVVFLKKGGRWSVVYLHGNMKDKFLGKMVSKERLSFLRGPTAFQGQCTQFKVDVPFALLIHPLQGQCTL